MPRIFLLNLLLTFFAAAGFPQIPAGYYDAAAGLNGQALLTALHGIIDEHVPVAYGDLYFHFSVTDIKPDNTVWDMYSDNPAGPQPYVYHYNAGDECGNYSNEGDCFNREHSWPKSWFGGDVMPMYSDLFHLYPTDGYVNNKRGNFPYGEVGTASWTSLNGSRVGSCSWPGYSATVFEPVDEYKGDLARTFFYMSVRYYGEDAGWPGSDQSAGSQLKPWALSLMLSWDQQDPVSQKEADRNDAVYQVQQNRNPFIDHPEYAQLIWGPAGTAPPLTCTSPLSLFPNPATETVTVGTGSLPQQGDGTLTLYSAGGEILKEITVTGGQGVQIGPGELGAGAYFLRLVHPGLPTPLVNILLIR